MISYTWEEEDYELILWDDNSYEFWYQRYLVFSGDDFKPSPLCTPKTALGALLGFLPLRPGDTDAEHFDDYTQTQLDFCVEHGEALSLYAMELVA